MTNLKQRYRWLLPAALLLVSLGALSYWSLAGVQPAQPEASAPPEAAVQNLPLGDPTTRPALSWEELAAASNGSAPLLTADSQPIPPLEPGLELPGDGPFMSERMRARREARKATKGGRKEREEQVLFMRTYPGTTFPLDARQKGYDLLLAQDQVLAQEETAGSWTPVGPAPIKGGNLGNFAIDSAGRTTALLVHPQNSDLVYAGGAQGGIWKTTNGGQSWIPLTDGQVSLATGTMAFDPTNPNTLYVGTGEPHGSSDSYYGAGLLRSTDAGATWVQLGADKFIGMGISDIVIPASSPSTIWVAASANVGGTKPLAANPGIYRSTNSGANWTAVVTICDNQGVCTSPSSLVQHPSNSNILYAGFDQYGILKSTNGGSNWNQVFSLQQGIQRAELAMSPSNPDVLYAGLEAVLQNGSTFGAVFRTTNAGGNWSYLNSLQVSYCGDQCGYDNVLTVHPANPNFVLAGGQALYSNGLSGIDGVIFRSTNGGVSWDKNAGVSSNTTLHPDLHDIVFAPNNQNVIYLGTDGGVFRSSDGGTTWQPRQGNMATLQFQSVTLHPTNPNILFGGMQDNAKAKSTDGGATWLGVDAGDGGDTAIDPFDSKYWYGTRFSSSGQYMQFQRNDASGSLPSSEWPIRSTGINLNDRVLFYAPLAVDPNTAGVTYWGTHRLYRSTNRGNNWSAISGDLTKNINRKSALSIIAVKQGLNNTILVGTADGNVQLTTNGGTNWTNVTKSPLPNRFVTDAVIQDANVMFVGFGGFSQNTPGFSGHVYRTTNAGQTWVDVSKTGQVNGLPDLPVLALALDPAKAGNLYAGTDLGVYRTTDGGATWTPFNAGFPRVAVFDLTIQSYPNGKRYLMAATYGRSQFRYDLSADDTPGPTPTPTTTPNASLTRRVYLPITVRSFGDAPVPTATPTRTPTPPTTQTTIRNGNFEQGRDGAWNESSTHGYDLVVNSNLPVTPRSGSWLAWLGGDNNESSVLSQSVTLPASPAMSLTFWYYIGTTEFDCTADIAEVKVNNSSVFATGLCSTSATGTWKSRNVNLGAWTGQTVSIAFRTTTDFALNSNFFVDDVSLQNAAAAQEVEETPSALATPSPQVTLAPEATPVLAPEPAPAKGEQVKPAGVISMIVNVGTDLLAGPEVGYRTLDRAAAGTMLAVTGASSDGLWYQVVCPEDAGRDCWLPVAAAQDGGEE